ncbi:MULTISPECIES: SDR family oxidoreductase [Streptomyces]|uniref:NAD(P)H-binding protein n=1 Tax=Streptomyces cyaneofuscatus TaxID=66883 RepID=A0ABZ1EQY0_9ACTN|nr:NAD(P)H-binding protein [Streptomyces cyaneofuscatus]WSB06530.1 NAD(P)H-binding protein [Streptomyces cyaneofuscatus]WSD49935.1 NAD(P)H-binding protein [Streptomyces cyaneofuscatus]WTA93353.1 NAD(P)H-binding protein [Streptomyces cyaneofuscatus]
MTTILVTGATGTLGRQVSERLRTEGADVRGLSRRSPSYAVDLRDGKGLDAAVDGVDTIVHCASSPRGGDDRAAGFLIEAARRAGVPHLVYISIVGVDRVPLGYYTLKHQVERMIEDSGVGATIQRTTQFHDLVLSVVSGAAKLPVLPVPAGVSVQPVDSGEVADRLAALALGAPAGRVPDLGGPEVRKFTDLAGAYLRATGRRRRVVPVRLAGKAYAAYRSGGHLSPEHAVGTVTFEEFLARRHRRTG